MKEMVGGCCVCSDERGWPENPLVYCDGQNCTVAVHQACYGIVTVPTGPWFCRKCESQERSAKVRCELCPSRDGALKRTDNQGWAHVVCALYIPEVRFGNVTTMEPIILQLIPQERYAKTCYICHDIGKPNRANVGACMQCNKFNCKQQFHVTCAQSLGLLCEEAGNYLDNVKYCGYCQHHYSKLKKGGNVKTIPPYKPITHDSSGSDSSSSPEKEIDSAANATASSTSATSIKITTNTGVAASTSSSTPTPVSSTKQRKSSTASKQSSSSSSSSSSGISTGSSTNNNVPITGNLPSNVGPTTVGLPLNNTTIGVAGNAGTNGGSGTSSSGSNSSKTSSSSSNSSKEKDKHSKGMNKMNSSKEKDKDKDQSSSSSSSSSTREKSSKSKNKDLSDHGNSIGGVTTVTGIGAGSASGSGLLAAPPAMGLDLAITTTSDGGFSSSDTLLNAAGSAASGKSAGGSAAKKRKAESKASTLTDNVDINHPFRDIIKDVSVTLMPLPLDKSSDLGEIEKSSKKQKTELSPPTHQSTDAGIANAPQVAPVDASNSSSSSSSSSSVSSHHKQAKERDERLRSSPPYATTANVGITSGSSGGVAGSTAATAGSTTTSGAPSLYVSVPLSTANVPGVNLPSTTTSDHPTPSQSTRAAIQQQLQATSSIIERQSPRIHHQVTSSPAVPEHGTFSLQSPAHAVLLTSGKSPSPSVAAGLTATTTESGNLKISYEKQNSRVAQLQEQESAPVRRSRTPDSATFTSSFSISASSQSTQSTTAPSATTSVPNGGLKFTYEAQPGVAATSTPPVVDTSLASSNATTFKDSPPSSPGSEAGSARKRGRKANDVKDVKVFQNGGCAVPAPTQPSATNGPMHATHMLGNQLNPTSSVAQKLTDQLHMEIQDHSVYSEAQPPQFIGVPFPAKPVNNVRTTASVPSGANSLASMFGGGNGGGFAPQSLEQLLERQWEQGSQFLMEQAQHFDIASLLSCLHQLQTENVRLEEHVNNLIARRDHLLAVNARLAIPLNANVSQSQVNLNNIHLNGPTPTDVAVTAAAQSAAPASTSSANVTASSNNATSTGGGTGVRAPRSASASAQLPTMENGIDFRHSSHQQSPAPVPPTSASALPPSTGSSLRHSSTAHANFSNTTSPSSASHHSNHQQHHQQHQQHQLHQQQQQQQQSQQAPNLPPQHGALVPSSSTSSSSSSSASSVNAASASITTGSSRQAQQQQLPLPPSHLHQTQPPHTHQQPHHPQSHHSHHVQQQQQQQQQQPQPLLSHHPHHSLVQQQQHPHHHHHPSSTGTAASHHMQQTTSHHQISMSSSDVAMRTGGGGGTGVVGVGGTGAPNITGNLGRSGNSGNSGVGGGSSMHTGRPALGDTSAYHPVYSHQSQLRRDESHGKPS